METMVTPNAIDRTRYVIQFDARNLSQCHHKEGTR